MLLSHGARSSTSHFGSSDASTANLFNEKDVDEEELAPVPEHILKANACSAKLYVSELLDKVFDLSKVSSAAQTHQIFSVSAKSDKCASSDIDASKYLSNTNDIELACNMEATMDSKRRVSSPVPAEMHLKKLNESSRCSSQVMYCAEADDDPKLQLPPDEL